MKTPVKGSLLAAVFLAIAFVTGCATIPPVDWNSRVGHYSYAQAINELGPPNRQVRLSSGAIEFKWFVQPNGVNSLPNNGLNNGFGAGPNLTPAFNNQYLQLTFDANGVLANWSKKY